MKIVLGVIGESGSGKETFAKLLSEFVAPHSVKLIRTSDILKETLLKWGLDTSRENYIKVSVAMRSTFGEDVLPNAIKESVLEAAEDIVILDGLRWPADVEMLRSLPSQMLVYVTASAEVRFARTQKRQEKHGEKDTDFQKFLQENQSPADVAIPRLGAEADFRIENNGSLEEFQSRVQEFATQLKTTL